MCEGQIAIRLTGTNVVFKLLEIKLESSGRYPIFFGYAFSKVLLTMKCGNCMIARKTIFSYLGCFLECCFDKRKIMHCCPVNESKPEVKF